MLKDITSAGCIVVNTTMANYKIWLRVPGALSDPVQSAVNSKSVYRSIYDNYQPSDVALTGQITYNFWKLGPCLSRKKRLGNDTVIQRMKLIQKRQKFF